MMNLKTELERNYKRNFLSFMIEAFLFQFAVTVFSAETVLPVYVSEISSKSIYISLISIIYYGLLYVSAFFSCVLGVNAKSPKWISVKVCLLQRLGFFLFFISTYLAGNRDLFLIVFYSSLVMHTCAGGMSTPLWNQMVAAVIPKNIGNFYGAYSMIGSASGIIASLIFAYFLKASAFPLNYRALFLIGLVCSLAATAVIIIGVKEVTDERIPENLKTRDIIPVIKRIYKSNKEFRSFTVMRVISACTEFAVPYYIIKATQSVNSPFGFAGVLTALFFVAKMFGSIFFGKISDRFGTNVMLRISCFIGLCAALLAIPELDYRFAALMYFIAGFAVQGIYLSNGIASIRYSKGINTPIYSAAIGILSAPVYIVVPLLGTYVAGKFSYSVIFGFIAIIYIICISYSIFTEKKASYKEDI